MTLPVGTISLADVNVELGLASTTNISLNQANVRTLAGVPSGTISMSNLQGKSNDYPAQTLTFDGQSLNSPRVTLSGSTAFTASVAGSTSILGSRISQLHIVCWGAGGAGATWPSSAAGGYGGAGYRISWLRSSGGAVATFLNSITGIAGAAGNGGTAFLSGSFADNRQAGGAGGTSYVNINGTRVITAKGGNGARQIYNNGDANYLYPTYTSAVGDNGGTGAAEGGSGGAATYGGGGGASSGSTGYGSSTYGGRGGSRLNGGAPGYTPAGGGGGYDTGAAGNYPKGGIGRVVIYINTGAPF